VANDGVNQRDDTSEAEPTIIEGKGVAPKSAAEPVPTSSQVAIEELRRPARDRTETVSALAEGGMGRIDVAFDRALERRVARKTIHKELLAKERTVRLFLREARVTGQLDHPNIVPVYDIGEDPTGALYFTMKLVRGKTFKEILRELPEGRLESPALYNLLDVVIKVCDALAFAHARGVVHCDVKPENVMVGDYGQVYLMDWGVARLEEVQDTAAIIGTTAYMSPEQARGDRASLDARSDVFLVGAMLYEIVTRTAPYKGSSRDEALRRAAACEFVPPREAAPWLPPELERIVHKAMSKEPSARFRDTDALKEDLLRFMRGGAEFPLASFAKGSYIVREGDPGNTAYIIVSGRCEVLKIIEGTVTPLQTLLPGDVFGEMAVLTESPRTATILALEDTTVLVVEGDVLRQELEAMKPWMASLLRRLAQRFQDMYRQRRVISTFAPTMPALRLCNQVLMHLTTWSDEKGGVYTAKWTKVAAELETQLGTPPLSIGAVMARYPQHVKVDIDADTIELRDAASLKKRLDAELGITTG
jgi:serine/threonine-protein kinase